MERFKACINEGLFKDAFTRYRLRVLDRLKGLGVVFGMVVPKEIEDWIQDFFRDRCDENDCALAIRDEVKFDRRKNYARIEESTVLDDSELTSYLKSELGSMKVKVEEEENGDICIFDSSGEEILLIYRDEDSEIVTARTPSGKRGRDFYPEIDGGDKGIAQRIRQYFF